MIIQSITIKNFRSFKGEQVFTFTRSPGLYFMTGKNELEPSLEANGAGKSSLWEAIYWCFYDELTTKLRAGDVGNWENASPRVEVDGVWNDGTSGIITRTWGPKLLTFTGNGEKQYDLSQQLLNKKVTLDSTAFINSIFFAQKSDKFPDLSPASRTELFSTVLGLDQWADYSDAAKDETTAWETKTVSVERLVASLEGKLAQIIATSYDQDVTKWEIEQATKVGGQQLAIKLFEEHLNEDSKLVEQLKEVVIQTQQERNELLKLLQEKQSEINLCNSTISSTQSSLTKIQTVQSVFKENMIKFANLSICSNCLQPVGEDHKQTQILHLAQSAEELQTEIDTITATIKKYTETRQAVINELTELSKKAKTVEKEYNDRVETKAQAESTLAVTNSQLASSKAVIRQLEEQTNPWIIKQQNLEVQKTAIQKELEEAQALHLEFEKNTIRHKYWIKGFKEIRLSIITKALTQFGAEANSALNALGLVDWKVEFVVDAETKSKTIQRRFQILVYSPYNKVPVPWESWSGGETQRLKLAITIGLSNLILSGLGISCNIEIWDEPTTWLSGAGIDDLLQSLQDRSTFLKKQIWIVDHKALSFGGFSEIATVIKDKNGSRIEFLKA